MQKQIESIIREAAKVMLSYDHPAITSKEGHANFVTEADKAVQDYLFNRLQQAFPKAAFMGEEEEEHRLGEGLTFIIDPIDGTTNYIRHRRNSMISVGAVENGSPVFGGLYNPYLDEFFFAEKGKGALCNGEAIHVSDEPFETALIQFGTAPYNVELAEATGRALPLILCNCGDIRRGGSSCVDQTEIAAGRAEGMFEFKLSPWDYCAASLVLTEAGGVNGNILGGPVVFDQPMPYMAATPRVFDKLQALLQQAWEGK